ncbi:MAG TPA: erythromycin esterase family protein [Chthoniobacterales bacterium]|jgi:erythromycin esterase-like protein|nr:erythromycin esterase family protein [Chthoniobacterales bacterium]
MSALSDRISAAADPLAGSPNDYDSLIEMVGEARFVLLGEASHGTHEFYRERALITKWFIYQRGFNAVAAEADWPDAYRINRFVRGEGPDLDSVDALNGFRRFPQWMWRNADVLDFVAWLREHNDEQSFPDRKAGFYGLDLYSLHASIEAVLAYLDKVDPEAAKRARHHYSCFEHFGKEVETYGYAAGLGMASTCEDAVVQELIALRRREMDYLQRDGQVAAEAYFCAQQNALVVRNAEEYYRNMFRREVSSWNLRDSHMMETLVSLGEHLSKEQSAPAKIVVWAHNSHLGDARATQMGERGELNLGQLVRERFGKEAVSIGFTTYTGTVTAASNWGEPAERKQVRRAHRASYEALFHEVDTPRFFLNLRDNSRLAAELRMEKLERAIGVIYRPETELQSHYFHARLSDQFDGIIHFDHTRAVEPLERTTERELGEVEETFPTGL